MIRPQWILFLIILVNYDERKTASWPYGWVLTSNCWTTKDCYTRRLYVIFLQKMFVSRGAARNFPEVRTVASFPNDISSAWLEYISVFMVKRHSCLRKQPTLRDATNCFPTKWCLRNERRISYWWRVTIQTWVVHLMGWRKFPSTRHARLRQLRLSHTKTGRKRRILWKKNLSNLEGSYIGKWFPTFTGAPNGTFWEKGLKRTTKHE